jgi:hypothetical protein
MQSKKMTPENTVDVQAILTELDELMRIANAIEKLSCPLPSTENVK